MRFLPLQMPPLRFIFYHIFSLHSILFQSFFRTKAKFDIFHNRFVQFVQSLLYHDGHRVKNILRSVEGAEAFLAFFKPFRDRSVGFARFGNMHETARSSPSAISPVRRFSAINLSIGTEKRRQRLRTPSPSPARTTKLSILDDIRRV